MKGTAFFQGEIKADVPGIPYDQFSSYNYLDIDIIILGWRKFKQFYSKEGTCPFSKRNNRVIVKIHWRDSQNVFSRTTGPILTKLGKKDYLVKGLYVRLRLISKER